jgi:hypothetical protein
MNALPTDHKSEHSIHPATSSQFRNRVTREESSAKGGSGAWHGERGG